jgi:hypothetical protein
VPKKNGLLRPIAFLDFQDRLIYQALGNIVIANCYNDLVQQADKSVFAPIPQKPDSPFTLRNSISNRYRKGQYERFSDEVRRMVRKAVSEENSEGIRQTDIASFYPSIDHHVLLEVIQQHNWLNDERLIDLLWKSLVAWSPRTSLFFQRGVPIGYETSDILATLYLFDIDEAMKDYCRMIRYIDDIYFVAANSEQADFAMTRLDYLLQARALSLQPSKTGQEILEVIAGDIDDFQFEKYIQSRISSSEVLLIGNRRDFQKGQAELYRTFFELWEGGAKEKDEKLFESTLAYILRRLRIKDQDIRDIALQLLRQYSHRSFNITAYLSLFLEDNVVIDALFEVVENPFVYTEVRANAFRALIKVSPDSERLRTIAESWCKQDDWYMRLVGIEILQKFSSPFHFLSSLIDNETVEPVLAAAIHIAFNRATNIDDKTLIIGKASRFTSYTFMLLVIYLWRRQSEIEDQNVSKYEPNLDSIRIKPKELGFREELLELCKFEINPHLPLNQVFEGILTQDEGAQLLRDAIDAKQVDRNRFVRAISEFSRLLLIAVARSIGKELESVVLYDLVEIDERISVNMRLLLECKSKLDDLEEIEGVFVLGSTYQVIEVKRMDELERQTSKAFAVAFDLIHNALGLIQPDTLKSIVRQADQKLNFSHQETRKPHVFLSYAHENQKTVIEIYHTLQNNGIWCWIDFQGIRIGASWNRKIWNELEVSWSLVVFISPESMASDYVEEEYLWAAGNGKHIFPLVLIACSFPPIFYRLQRIDGTGDLKTAVTKLIDEIKSHKDYPRP